MPNIYDMSSDEIRILTRIVGLLSNHRLDGDIREAIFPDLMRLMRADVLASFVWAEESRSFGQPFLINQDAANVDRYERWFQFRDPATRKLKALKRPANVDEVIDRGDFLKTEFYNDFLAKDGMFYGVNHFLRSEDMELADVRLWRNRSRVPFGTRELDLLAVLTPHLTAALLRSPETTLSKLTPRERDVALLIARGNSDKDIARICDIGFATVRTHVGRILAKLECSNRTELAVLIDGLARINPS